MRSTTLGIIPVSAIAVASTLTATAPAGNPGDEVGLNELIERLGEENIPTGVGVIVGLVETAQVVAPDVLGDRDDGVPPPVESAVEGQSAPGGPVADLVDVGHDGRDAGEAARHRPRGVRGIHVGVEDVPVKGP